MLSTCLIALSAAVLAAAAPTWLFFKLRTELRELASKAASQEQLSKNAGALAARLSAVEARAENLERNHEAHAQWLSQAESLNLNRRGQVVRLHRRGESVPEIATALRMASGEVALMIKVYEFGRQPPGMQEENF